MIWRPPFVTWILCAAIVICHLLKLFAPAADMAAGLTGTALPEPLMAFLAWLQPVTIDGGPEQLVSYMFLHADRIHLVCNLGSLLYIGTMVERLYGHGRCALVFFVTGIAGGLLFRVVHAATGDMTACVGASGAIFGLLGAYVGLLVRELVAKTPVMIPQRTAGSLLAGAAIVLVINIVTSFLPGVAWEAHIGGLICGIIMAFPMVWQMSTRDSVAAYRDRRDSGRRGRR